jgi:hypothetical protein
MVEELILRILGEIETLHGQAEKYVEKYDLKIGQLPVGDVDQSLQLKNALVKVIAKLNPSRKSKSRIA